MAFTLLMGAACGRPVLDVAAVCEVPAKVLEAKAHETSGGSDSPIAPPRHVIVISLDTARADHFGFLGRAQAETPHLDRLARESIVLLDLLTVAPTTLASHVSLLTGTYPHHHGTPRNGFMVNLENQMLAELLERQGFHTAGFAASFALDSRFDFAQGFEHYDERMSRYVGEGGADQDQRTATQVTDAVLQYLDEQGVPGRLFLFVHYFDAHQPYDPPPEFEARYDPESDDSLWSLAEIQGNRRANLFRSNARTRQAKRQAQRYAGEIAYLDQQLGRLLDGLRERGVLDESLLVMTSDHGETFLEHPEAFDHGFEVYQTTISALGLIRRPGGASGGTTITRPVSTIDVLPTILTSLGLEVPDAVANVAIADRPMSPF